MQTLRPGQDFPHTPPMTKPDVITPTGVLPGRMTYQGPFELLCPQGDPRLLLVCDHASNAVPPPYGSLGLPETSFTRHIAYDIGARDVVERISERLNAPAILAGFSRLLIDPNRGEDDPTLVMRLSDGEIIPGNASAESAEIEKRITDFHRPYHRAIDDAIERALGAEMSPVLISVHSFTPAWRGRERPWHCGILWWGDKPTADFCLSYLGRESGLVVGDNEPYSGELEGDSMDRHGTRRGISHALIEIRQDLIASREGCAEWAERLAPMLMQLAERPKRVT